MQTLKSKPFFTRDEECQRLWELEEIKNIMAKHSYYYSNGQRREELSNLWVTTAQNRKTASLGNNWGYYVGMDDISHYYVVEYTEKLYERLQAYHDADPSVEVNSLNLGKGVMAHHTSTTPLCYISQDGRYARYMGYDLGEVTFGKPNLEADAYFVFGLLYCDLIKENGQWKIWHLIMTRDHTMPNGESYTGTVPARILKKGEDPLDDWDGTPTKNDHKVYEPFFGWEYLYQDMPTEFYTYTDLTGYGPESNMGYDYVARERRSI